MTSGGKRYPVKAEAGAGRGRGWQRDLIARVSLMRHRDAQRNMVANVFRTDYIPTTRTGGLMVKAVDTGILDTLRGTVAQGRFLDDATARYPVAVLGSVAAERLGVGNLSEQRR